METNHTKIDKRHGYLYWTIRIALLLGLPILIYYGYCWGWWRRHSLLLQYLFQCSCPPASEEARYPDKVDVIVPACQYVSSRLSPSGRLLYITEKKDEHTITYLLDLQMGEKILFTIPDAFYFLTDDLLYVYYKGDDYILDWTTGEQYPIRRFVFSHPDAYVNGEVNLNTLGEVLRGSKYVFLINNNSETVVALASDFRTAPEHNFLTVRYDILGHNIDNMEQFLQENNITYQNIPADFPHQVLSPDGTYIARNDGIYLAATNQKIASYGRSFLAVRGWTSDGHGVIYSRFLNPCVIETNWGIMDDEACYFEVPQPVLKLKVPEEYSLPKQTP
jgi:hypothetical protein